MKINQLLTLFNPLLRIVREDPSGSQKNLQQSNKMIKLKKLSWLKLLPKFFIGIALELKNFILYPEKQTKYSRYITKQYDSLQMVMNWLNNASKATKYQGVSAGISLLGGWEDGYVETTGYIIETFIAYAKLRNDNKFLILAKKMADFLVAMQLECGGFQAFYGVAPVPVVFNTGQVIFGLVEIYKLTLDEKYLNSAIKAGDWLISVQEPDGAWRKQNTYSISHSYDTRVSWALLELYLVSKQEKYKLCAQRELEWALSNLNESSWLKYNNFLRKTFPITHTIAYSIEGFLAAGKLLKEKKYIDVALTMAEKVCDTFLKDNRLFASYNHKWQGRGYFVVITGAAQFSILWFKGFELTHKMKFLYSAKKMLEFLRWVQRKWDRVGSIIPTFATIRGAMQCSYPVWGDYCRYSFSNWTAKFFADALMLEEKIEKSRRYALS